VATPRERLVSLEASDQRDGAVEGGQRRGHGPSLAVNCGANIVNPEAPTRNGPLDLSSIYTEYRYVRRISTGTSGLRLGAPAPRPRRVGATIHAQLDEDVVNVILDRLLLDRETVSDLLVRKPLAKQLEDLSFARRELLVGD
jgi:hypothetical protein